MFHKQRQVHLCLGCGWQDALYILAAIYIYHFTSSSHHILQLTGTAVATNISLVGQTVQHLIHNTIYIYIKKHLPNYFVCLKTKKKKICVTPVQNLGNRKHEIHFVLHKKKQAHVQIYTQHNVYKKVCSCIVVHTAQCAQKLTNASNLIYKNVMMHNKNILFKAFLQKSMKVTEKEKDCY